MRLYVTGVYWIGFNHARGLLEGARSHCWKGAEADEAGKELSYCALVVGGWSRGHGGDEQERATPAGVAAGARKLDPKRAVEHGQIRRKREFICRRSAQIPSKRRRRGVDINEDEGAQPDNRLPRRLELTYS